MKGRHIEKSIELWDTCLLQASQGGDVVENGKCQLAV